MGGVLGGQYVLNGQCTRGTLRIKWVAYYGGTTY